MTTNADRYVSRARFSASDRPVPPDLDVVAAIEARRANRLERDELREFERSLRSALGRLERSMGRTRSQRAARRASGELGGEDDVASSRASTLDDATLSRHQSLVDAIRRLEAVIYEAH